MRHSGMTMRRSGTIKRTVAGLGVATVALVLTGAAFAGSAKHVTAANVTVTFTDATLRVSPASPASGPTTFVVHNHGKKLHVLAISGPGVKGVRTAKLAAGGSAKLTVTLRAGAYVLSDPVGLGVYNVQFLDIVPAATLTAKGNGSVVAPPVDPPPMCGSYLAP